MLNYHPIGTTLQIVRIPQKPSQAPVNVFFLRLQMISFEFLRVYSIGWKVSRGKHFVHMTQPGARDWPVACFSRPISHTMTFTTIQQVNK